jgi:hypothetical protein
MEPIILWIGVIAIIGYAIGKSKNNVGVAIILSLDFIFAKIMSGGVSLPPDETGAPLTVNQNPGQIHLAGRRGIRLVRTLATASF